MTYNYHGLQTDRSRKLFLIGAALVVGASLALTAIMKPASALSQVVVTPSDTQGWTTADTRPGGSVNFVFDATAPGTPHMGALKLTDDATTTSKAQYMHEADIALSDVNELAYSTKRLAGPSYAAASYQLAVNLNGDSGFTTFVYEPYQNGTVDASAWQTWDVDQGQFWSSRSVTCSNGAVIAGGGGAPFYTLAQIETMCPEAVAVGFGVNIGSNNPSFSVESDLVNFNGTVYNFEPDSTTCKNGGWQDLGFKNQGECVATVMSNQNSKFNQ